MKRIDLHCHVLAFPEYSPRRWGGNKYLSVEEQIEIHDKCGVTFGVLHPIVIPEAHWATMSNEETQYIVNRYPDRFTWFCNVDPRQGNYTSKSDLGYIISQYKELGAKGLGELGTPLYADDPMMSNLFRFCEELNMPVLVHVGPWIGGTYGIVDDPGLPRIEKMLKKYPDMQMIGHSAAFWCEIAADSASVDRDGRPEGRITKEGRLSHLMREYGNLCCDISAGSGKNALMRDPEYAVKFIDEFADRIYYGADTCKVPGNAHAFPYDFLQFLDNLASDGSISPQNYEKIMYKNAAKLLGMEDRFNG